MPSVPLGITEAIHRRTARRLSANFFVYPKPVISGEESRQMSIFEDFHHKESYIGNRRTRKNNPRQYTLWRNRIMKFLTHCDGQHVYRISDIRQKHYDGFMAHIAKGRSPSTIRDWKYALAEFVQRAHLNIAVQTSPSKQQAKRKQKAYRRLSSHFDDRTARKIVSILEELI